jgi:hypothetical protein
MRTTVTLDADVYEAAQTLSQSSGRRLGEVLSELARRGLKAGSPLKRARKQRFATFEVPAHAPIIPGTRASEILAKEGL